jgi:SAM-dependent methyltransferase
MAKQGEIEYMNAIGDGGRNHVTGRPFTDYNCGQYLARIGQVMDFLPEPPARVLDLGCGSGWTSSFLAQRGYEVLGIDIAPDMIRAAEQSRDSKGLHALRFMVGDYESLDCSEEFDAVVFFDSLHHAENELDALRAAYHALRSGGTCVVSEPGVGHHKTPASQQAVQQFGVTEKEMPPFKIARMAKAIGFRGIRTYAHQGQIFALSNGPVTSQRAGLLGWVLRRHSVKPLLVFLLMALLKHWSGVVVLTK